MLFVMDDCDDHPEELQHMYQLTMYLLVSRHATFLAWIVYV